LNSIFPVGYIYKSLRKLLTETQLRNSRLILIIATLISLADVIGLSAMVPVLMLAIDRSFLEKSSKLRWVFDAMHFDTESAFLIFLIALIVAFFLLKNLLAMLFYNFTRKNAVSIVSHLAEKKYHTYFGSNLAGIRAAEEGKLEERVLFTPYYFVSGVYLPFINLISESVVVVALISVFTLYNPLLLLLIGGLLLPSFYLVNRYTRNRIFNLGQLTGRYREKATGILGFGLAGFMDIRINRAEQRFFEKFYPYKEGFIRNGIKGVNYQLIPARINEIVALTGIILLVLYGYFISDNTSEVRVIAALLAFSIFRLIPAANRMMQAMMHLRMNHYTIDLLQENPTQEKREKYNGSFQSALRIRNLNFTYEDRNTTVFKDASIEIKAGETTGIRGISGSGKTTLVKLILGLETPDSGEIFVDDQSLHIPTDISALCSYVSQEPFLFEGSLAENVALGLAPGNIDTKKVSHCLKLAAFQPNTPDTEWPFMPVEENGNNFSEGQKQRIALARALYFDRPILILDEPTSALDAQTEQEVIASLLQLKTLGKTIIIIAHRERIMDLCDRIYEISNQQIVSVK
jgi:ATP-binding cassette, subfamily B, bacterial PglK